MNEQAFSWRRFLSSKCSAVALLALVACGSTDGEVRERIENPAVEEAAQGLSADLIRVTYTAQGVPGVEGAKCDYERSWLQIANLTESLRSSLNVFLDHDPRQATGACKNSARYEGGSAVIASNTKGVLSVIYTFDTVQYGDVYSEISLANLDLKTGKPITILDVVDASGVEFIISQCEAAWTDLTKQQGDARAFKPHHCRQALMDKLGEANEQFSLTTAGVVVHLDRQVSRDARHMLPEKGFLMPWSSLRGYKSGDAAWRLAP
ncbi:MAG: hypothetical protein U0174_21855 [Polyangiaceae bacterium]